MLKRLQLQTLSQTDIHILSILDKDVLNVHPSRIHEEELKLHRIFLIQYEFNQYSISYVHI